MEWLLIGCLVEESISWTQKSAHSAFQYGMCLEMGTYFCTHKGWRKRNDNGSKRGCDIVTLLVLYFWKTISILWEVALDNQILLGQNYYALNTYLCGSVSSACACRLQGHSGEGPAQGRQLIMPTIMPRDKAEQLLLSSQEHKRGSWRCLCKDNVCYSH